MGVDSRPDGSYSVKSAYTIIRNWLPSDGDALYNKVWNVNVPPKIATLLCSAYLGSLETANHLFFECPLKWVGISSVLQHECRKVFQQFQGLSYFSLTKQANWQSIWYAVISVIWWSRNQLVFNCMNTEITKGWKRCSSNLGLR